MARNYFPVARSYDMTNNINSPVNNLVVLNEIKMVDTSSKSFSNQTYFANESTSAFNDDMK